MKCQMCNGEGGKIPHPENYGSYREDCPACNGTGEQPPVDKKLLRYRVLRASTHEGVSISLLEHADGDIYKVNEVDKCVTTLKSELQAARGEIEKKTESIKMLVLDAKRLEDENAQLKAERDGLRCCGNCESSVDNRGQLFCQLKKQDVDINYSCNEWD